MSEEPLPAYGTPEPERPEPRRSEPRNETSVRLLGGVRRAGRWSAPRQLTAITVVGGVDLDLTDADLPPGDVVLVHVSLVGGVNATVPARVGVRVEGVRLLGGQRVDGTGDSSAATTLVIRSFGVVGGVRVRRV